MTNKLITLACASLLTMSYAQISSADNNHHQGTKNCSLKTLKGSYLFSSSGKDLNADFANAGIARFNGAGAVTQISSTTNSVVTPAITPVINIKYTGTYIINSDCTGTLQLNTNTFPINYNIFVSKDGSLLNFIQTDAGIILSGEGKRTASK